MDVPDSVVHLGEPGLLPVNVPLRGGRRERGDRHPSDQDFTAFGVAAPVSDPENIVLAVPGIRPRD